MIQFPVRLARLIIKKIKTSPVCCSLETPVTGALCPGTFNSFSGWVFDTHGRRIIRVEVVQNGQVLGTCDYGLEREDVHKAYPRYPQALHSSFSGWTVIPENTAKPVCVYAVDDTGRRHLLGSRQLPWQARATCFFKKPTPKAQGPSARTQPRAAIAIPSRILIAGQAKTGTTALFFKISNSLAAHPEIASQTKLLFEPKACSFPETDRVLAKILISPNAPYTKGRGDLNARQVRYDDFENFSKKILLIRDPRDRLISALLYSAHGILFRSNPKAVKSFISLLKKKEQDPRSVSVRELIECSFISENFNFESWGDTFNAYALFFLDFKRTHIDYFTLKYEDFVRGEMGELEAFLGFPLSGEVNVQKTYERVVRTKTSGDWKNWFTEEDIACFRPMLQPTLQEFGYEDIWDLPEHQVILPEHGSNYIRRITKPYQ